MNLEVGSKDGFDYKKIVKGSVVGGPNPRD